MLLTVPCSPVKLTFLWLFIIIANVYTKELVWFLGPCIIHIVAIFKCVQPEVNKNL